MKRVTYSKSLPMTSTIVVALFAYGCGGRSTLYGDLSPQTAGSGGSAGSAGSNAGGSNTIIRPIAVSAGNQHTCASLGDGTIRCWGDNTYGQLGDGTNTASSVPVGIAGVTGTQSVSSGYSHTCAQISDGSVRCWGDNNSGQLGDGTTIASRNASSTVQTVAQAISVSAGYDHTCAMLHDGTVRCWGDDTYGELGNGLSGPAISNTPVNVLSISQSISISAGLLHNCAVIADGRVRCWGYNGQGQLGNGTTDNSNTPVIVVGISDAAVVSAGELHTCAVLRNGQVQCWGRNIEGQIGDGTNIGRNIPVTVNNITEATHVSASGFHTCATLSNGIVQCWGANDAGQLGNGTTMSPVT